MHNYKFKYKYKWNGSWALMWWGRGRVPRALGTVARASRVSRRRWPRWGTDGEAFVMLWLAC